MGRRHSIAAKKAAGDVAKGKYYSMMSKIIQIAAKKGADPKMNPSLEMALQKARYYGTPREIVDRAILKGSGQLEGESLEEIFYEGYGPNGTAILVKTLTGNGNRTASSMKLIFNKYGGGLGQPGSVARQFKETGIIIIDGTIEKQIIKGNPVDKINPLNMSEVENELLELPIQDLEIDENLLIISTDKQNFAEVLKEIEKRNYHITEGDLQFIPENEISLDPENSKKFFDLIDAIEGDEDVDKVRHNVKI